MARRPKPVPEPQPVGLEVRGLSKRWRTGRTVLEPLDLTLPVGGRLALIGRNGAGKSTLIKMLGGALTPTSGRIDWRMRPSWPLGFDGGFQGSLSGLDNIRFIARLHGEPTDTVRERVEAFADLGRDALHQPVRHYSSGMRARLAFGLCLAIDFDCLLIDELVAVGDARFQERCREALFERRAGKSFIMASHDLELLKRECDRALLLPGDGEHRLFDSVDEAVAAYAGLAPAAQPV